MRYGLLIIVSFVWLFLMSATSSYAVVPGMWPFLQSLMSFLPQILLFVMVGISMVFKFGTWKRMFGWILRKVRTKPGIVAATAVVILAGVGIYIIVTGSSKVAPQSPSDGNFDKPL